MVLGYANKNNQHLQGFSHSPSTAERQTALRKQSNTNTGWSTQPHLFPGTATASGSNRNTEQPCTIPAHSSCSANCSHQVRAQVKDWSIPYQELSLRYGKKSIKNHSEPILVLHHLLILWVLWHSWKCYWKYLVRWVLAKKQI